MGEQRVRHVLGAVRWWNTGAHGDVCGTTDDGDGCRYAVLECGAEAGDLADVQPAGVPDVGVVGWQLRCVLCDVREWNADSLGRVRVDGHDDAGGRHVL